MNCFCLLCGHGYETTESYQNNHLCPPCVEKINNRNFQQLEELGHDEEDEMDIE